MEECENCYNRFNWGISWGTLVMENNTEHKLCNYCSDIVAKNWFISNE